MGFEAAGWPAVAAALIAKLGFNDQMFLYKRWAEASLGPLWNEYFTWTGRFTRDHWDGFKFGFDVFALAAPQLVLALLGGWAAARFGLVVVPGSIVMGRRRAIPVRRTIAALLAAAVLLGTGVFAAKIRGRWLVYREWVHLEVFMRSGYEQTLAQIRSLDQEPAKMADNPSQRAAMRNQLVNSAERELRAGAPCRHAKGLRGRRPTALAADLSEPASQPHPARTAGTIEPASPGTSQRGQALLRAGQAVIQSRQPLQTGSLM